MNFGRELLGNGDDIVLIVSAAAHFSVPKNAKLLNIKQVRRQGTPL